MRFQDTGKIAEDFYIIGHPGVPVYLLDGPKPALFDAGFTALAKQYEKGIKESLGGRAPAYLFLTHSHFDHVGSAAYFKKVWPELQIVGSEKCRDILTRPGALQLINELNRIGIENMQSADIHPIHEDPIDHIDVEVVIVPDQTIELGPSLFVTALATPGHTWDFMSYWIPEVKILIASEAAGCDDGTGVIQTEFLIDYDVYVDSLKRLADLNAQILCPGHKIVLTGSDVRTYMAASLESARDYLDMVEAFLTEEKGDLKKVIQRVKAVEWDPKPWPKQPEQAYLLNSKERVEKIWERMQKKSSN
ncbi:MAG: MBL fold metallo-hydrolase [Deltaproteobacteria bacterium]|nr:MBL fold metallo-hydrolase [Deltaproteobacteria bacterium]